MNRFFLISILIFPLVLSGCILKKEAKDDSWKNEIAMAQECGMDSLRCCKDREPACNYGQCCVDPNDPKKDMCREDCTCGKPNNYCCQDGDPCGDGLACSEGICKKCGSKDEPCCVKNDACGTSTLACYNARCVECGQAGNPCCQKDPRCVNESQVNELRAECQNNLCQICGSNDKPICFSNPTCSPGYRVNGNSCIYCGEVNQPCCDAGAGKGYECNPQLNLTCNMGFCSEIIASSTMNK